MSNIGKNIATRRKELGLTQGELARKIGYKSKSTINKIELGINDIPQSKIEKFAEALDTSLSYIMGWEDEQKEKSANNDGLTSEQLALIEFTKTVPADKAEKVLRLMQSILEID